MMEGVRVSHQGLRAHSAEGSAGRITQAGLAARSTAGTAAKGMAIKGHEDLWVEIQANTFRNWVNETLKPVNIKVSYFANKALITNLKKEWYSNVSFFPLFVLRNTNTVTLFISVIHIIIFYL